MVPCFSSLSPKDVPTPAALGGVQDGHGGLVPEPEGRPALEQAERGDEEASEKVKGVPGKKGFFALVSMHNNFNTNLLNGKAWFQNLKPDSFVFWCTYYLRLVLTLRTPVSSLSTCICKNSGEC